MRQRGITPARSAPKGLAFEIADLIFIKAWADQHNFQMVVRLDHGVEDEEYEEVITFRAGAGSACQLIMWRDAGSVFVQPLIGIKRSYRSVAEVLESLDQKPNVVLTDISAVAWPVG